MLIRVSFAIWVKLKGASVALELRSDCTLLSDPLIYPRATTLVNAAPRVAPVAWKQSRRDIWRDRIGSLTFAFLLTK
jgi:hypothetical protein